MTHLYLPAAALPGPPGASEHRDRDMGRGNDNLNKAYWALKKVFSEEIKKAPPKEAKSKEEKERYTHLNAEFQRIARRDEKAFLTDQCKEIEENNRMGKTNNLFKKLQEN